MNARSLEVRMGTVERRQFNLEVDLTEMEGHITAKIQELSDDMKEGIKEDVKYHDRLEHDMDERFNQVDERFKQSDARFEKLERQVDARFKSIQGVIDFRFNQVDARFEKLEHQIDARFGKMETLLAQILECLPNT